MTVRQPMSYIRLASTLICSFALSWSLEATVGAARAEAASPDTAPAELVSALTQIETAASAGDIDAPHHLVQIH